MRRILRKIAEDDLGNLGDTSTLADPAVVDDLVAHRAGASAGDVVELAGRKLPAAELEQLIVENTPVADAVVVSPRGKGLWCFVARLKGWSAGPFLGAGALAALLLAAAAPGLLAPLYHPWMRLARALGRINAFVLLGLVYYAVLTPIGLLRRLSVPDPLDERPGAAPSRWRPRAPRPVEDYDRQF